MIGIYWVYLGGLNEICLDICTCIYDFLIFTKWFSHFVLAGFWQRIWVTVTFEWLGVYTPKFDVYLLRIFGRSPLHSYALLVYLWIIYSNNSMRDYPSRVHVFRWRYQYILWTKSLNFKPFPLQFSTVNQYYYGLDPFSTVYTRRI